MGVLTSYIERGSKTAVDTVLRPEIAYDTHDHHTLCLLLRSTFTDQPIKMLHEINAMTLKHKTAYLKLLSLPLSPIPLFSAHIKKYNR